MLCIYLKNSSPFFCLAAEEYFLKNFDDDIFMLWQSENTVVVGKHQNMFGEINYRFVRENNIAVARRISGGGTVFHDAGNVNFTFIKTTKNQAEISFSRFTQPVVEALAKLDIVATTSGRNDLLINGKKISGNAEHIYKNRVLHHGTLLYNSDLKNLGNAIKIVPGKYTSKAVQSNRSEVGNIVSFLKKRIDTGEFIRFLLNNELEKSNAVFYELNETDNKEIESLVKNKFVSEAWNFGFSPKYTFKNRVEIEGKSIEVELIVKRGKIENAQLSGSYFPHNTAQTVAEELKNEWHIFDNVRNVILQTLPTVSDDVVYCFF